MQSLGRVLVLAACVAAFAQSSSPSSAARPADTPVPAASPAQLTALIKQQFGDTFSLAEKFAHTLLAADFDGDGSEDLAIIAVSKDPLPDSYAFKYEVADPYHAYFGFSDPRLTRGFSADPEHAQHILVIFGSGKEGWHVVTPKAKFVLINVPFDSVEVGRMLITRKKPPIFVIKALEARVMNSAVFWDIKKKRWRWEPGDTIQ